MSLPVPNSNIPPKATLFDQVVNYVTKGEQIGGKHVESDASALAKQEAMSLFIAAPRKGENLNAGEKFLNGVFLCGVCTILSPALAGYAIKMNSLKKAATAEIANNKGTLELRLNSLEQCHKILAHSITEKATAEALVEYYDSALTKQSAEKKLDPVLEQFTKDQLEKQKGIIEKTTENIKIMEDRIEETLSATHPNSLTVVGNKLGIDPAERALKNFQIENNALNASLKKADENLQNRNDGLSPSARQLVHENVTKSLRESRENGAGHVLKELNNNIAAYEKVLEQNQLTPEDQKPEFSDKQLNYWLGKCTGAKTEVLKELHTQIKKDLQANEKAVESLTDNIIQVSNEYNENINTNPFDLPVDQRDEHIVKAGELEKKLEKLNNSLKAVNDKHKLWIDGITERIPEAKNLLFDELDNLLDQHFKKISLNALNDNLQNVENQQESINLDSYFVAEDPEVNIAVQLDNNKLMLIQEQLKIIQDKQKLSSAQKTIVNSVEMKRLEDTEEEILNSVREINKINQSISKEADKSNPNYSKIIDLEKEKEGYEINVIYLWNKWSKINKNLHPIDSAIKYNEGDNLIDLLKAVGDDLALVNEKMTQAFLESSDLYEYMEQDISKNEADIQIRIVSENITQAMHQLNEKRISVNSFFQDAIFSQLEALDVNGPSRQLTENLSMLAEKYDDFLNKNPDFDNDAKIRNLINGIKFAKESVVIKSELQSLLKNEADKSASQIRKGMELHNLRAERENKQNEIEAKSNRIQLLNQIPKKKANLVLTLSTQKANLNVLKEEVRKLDEKIKSMEQPVK